VNIENGDMPAMPVEVQWSQLDRKLHGIQTGGCSGWKIGLTKRELFAALAMQGLMGLPVEMSHVVVARSAVEQADALLAELAKKGGGE
jgi:hypothetical protein